MNNIAKEIFINAIKESSPSKLLKNRIRVDEKHLKIDDVGWELANCPIFIIAVGKASEEMCRSLQHLFNDKVQNYICIAPSSDDVQKEEKKNHFYASHPLPDGKSEQAAQALVNFVKDIPSDSLVIFALSGGTSSLVCKPADEISVADIAEVNKLLLRSGASIDEVNCVRKHLSDIKGGQLLNYFRSNISLIDLAISDVPGDDLETIGSGLTISDSTTFQDAYHILLEYNLWEKIPGSTQKQIEKGLTGEVPETIRRKEDPLQDHHSYIVGSARKFAQTLADESKRKGFVPRTAENYYNGPVDTVIKEIIKKVKKIKNETDKPVAIIYYGESTVKVTGEGKGGRNQEMALRAALEIADITNVTWLSAGTDGIDGPTDAAGAIVDGNTIQNAKNKDLNVDEFIENNDSYHFHEQMNTLLKTGPTGNNMMDVVLVLSGEI